MYKINDIFISLQGEGLHSGMFATFVRFANCNLACTIRREGFNCDTEFNAFEKMSAEEIIERIRSLSDCRTVILTGGEPMLQLDMALTARLHSSGFEMHVETNGTRSANGLCKPHHIACCPKTAEHTLKLESCDELRYVRSYGQPIPRPRLTSKYYYISPAFECGTLPRKNLDWCIQLVRENPRWRLSVQQHQLLDYK